MPLAELTEEAVDAFVHENRPGSPRLSAEIRHLGGALAEPKPHHDALASLEAKYVMFAVGLTMSEEFAVPVEAAVDRVNDALAPWNARTTYFNFSERPVEGNAFYTGVAYRRLRKVSAQFDPAGVFQSNHPIS